MHGEGFMGHTSFSLKNRSFFKTGKGKKRKNQEERKEMEAET